MPTADSRPTPSSWLTTLGWAAYLACSWTWCIGMFLPVLLIRDFGILGFIVFAVPNVIGAAAMAWVLRNPSQSASITHRHPRACWCFSLITMSFQILFFLTLLGSGPLHAPIWLAFIPLLAALAGIGRSNARLQLGAAALLVLSLAAFGLYLTKGEPSVVPSPGARPADLVWLAPVCIFGFGLCPYLDLTFHRVRRSTPGPSGPAAFTIGFAALFTPMILFTVAYSGWAAHLLDGRLSLTTPVQLLVVSYIIAQLVYTTVLHTREAAQHPIALTRAAPRLAKSGFIGPALAIAFALIVKGTAAFAVRFAPDLSAPELAYRLFMSFYGLVFPAYVWLCMIPTRNEATTQPPSRTKLIILFTAITLAAPFYWMGFIERQTWFLAPGLAIVLFARLFLPRSSYPSALTSP